MRYFWTCPGSCHLVGWFLILILSHLGHPDACGCLWSWNWRGVYQLVCKLLVATVHCAHLHIHRPSGDQYQSKPKSQLWRSCLRAGTATTAVLMATNVGLNLAPQVDTCEMFWPKFRGLGQRYFSKQQIPGGSAFKTVWWAWLRGVGTLVLCPCRAGYHSSQSMLCVSRHQVRALGRWMLHR